jgi:hypothetical protein
MLYYAERRPRPTGVFLNLVPLRSNAALPEHDAAFIKNAAQVKAKVAAPCLRKGAF